MYKPQMKGITLVELMIAMAISTILLAGVATVYTANRKGSNLNTGIARIQENLRFVGEVMAQDIRMAGYVGCRGLSLTNALASITPPELDIDTPVRGYEGDSSTSGFPAEIRSGTNPVTSAANPPQQVAITGSDALIVLRGSSEEFTVASHNAPAASLQLTSSPVGVLEQNDIVIVTDCWHSAVFQITNNVNNETIVHNTGAVSEGPGNCWKRLGPNNPRQSCSASNGYNYTYTSDARVLKMQATLYYVATSVSGQTTSLYRLGMDHGELSVREELVEGVESMQVLYGYDTNSTPDGIANRFVDAGWITASGDWDRVVNVRIGFLVATPNEVRSATDTRAYTIAGTTIDDTGTTVTHTADKKMRFAYTMTVKLRNKGVM